MNMDYFCYDCMDSYCNLNLTRAAHRSGAAAAPRRRRGRQGGKSRGGGGVPGSLLTACLNLNGTDRRFVLAGGAS